MVFSSCSLCYFHYHWLFYTKTTNFDFKKKKKIFFFQKKKVVRFTSFFFCKKFSTFRGNTLDYLFFFFFLLFDTLSASILCTKTNHFWQNPEKTHLIWKHLKKPTCCSYEKKNLYNTLTKSNKNQHVLTSLVIMYFRGKIF